MRPTIMDTRLKETFLKKEKIIALRHDYTLV